MENIFKRKWAFNLSEDGETKTTYFPFYFESLSVSEDQMIHFAAWNSGMRWLFTIATLCYLGTIRVTWKEIIMKLVNRTCYSSAGIIDTKERWKINPITKLQGDFLKKTFKCKILKGWHACCMWFFSYSSCILQGRSTSDLLNQLSIE